MNAKYEDGLRELKRRDFKKSKEIFLKIVEQKPENAESHLGGGISLFEIGDITEAEKHFKAAFSLFEAQFKLSEAYVSVIELLKMKPGVLNYTFNLMRVYLKLNFKKSFVEFLLKTVDNPEASREELEDRLTSLALLVKDENIKSILSFRKTRKGKEEEKLNPFENLELANLLFEIGSSDEAKIEYYKTARAFLSKDLKDKAQELFVKIKEIYPDDNEIEALKRDIEDYGKERESMDIKKRCKRLEDILPSLENENEARVRYSTAVIFKEYSRFEEAIKELNRVFSLTKTPEKIKAYVLLSQIYLDANDNTKAVATLKNVIEGDEFTGGELVSLDYKLGTIYERMKKFHEALYIYEKAIENDPDYLDLVEKIRKVKGIIEKQEVEIPYKKAEEIDEEIRIVEQIEKVVKVVVEEELKLRDRILYI